MNWKIALLLLWLPSIALSQSISSSDLQKLSKAYEDVIKAKDAELIASKAALTNRDAQIKTLQESLTAWDAKYKARELQLSNQLADLTRRYTILYEENERNKKARERNRRVIAPGVGGGIVAGLVLGLLIK